MAWYLIFASGFISGIIAIISFSVMVVKYCMAHPEIIMPKIMGLMRKKMTNSANTASINTTGKNS